MSLCARFIPEPWLHQVDHVAVAADPPRAWEAIRRLDLYRIGFFKPLLSLRILPELVRARLSGRPSPLGPHATVEDLTAVGRGFHLLEESFGRGFVVGAVGKFWEPSIDFREVDADGFTRFASPGFGKLVWGVEVAPREGGGSWLTVDLRVTTTDAPSQARFRPYWRLIGPFSHAIRRAALAQFRKELGGPREERVLPGDELLSGVRYERTHQAILEAPREEVWPWLVQLGCQRGGWYAIDLLDNGGRPSATTIEPRWQQLASGDLIAAVPDGSGAFGVLELRRHHALVLGSPSLRTSGPPAPGQEPPYLMTWAFVLEPVGDDATLLTVRVWAAYQPTLGFMLRHGWSLPAHELMTWQQLKHLKERVEAS